MCLSCSKSLKKRKMKSNIMHYHQLLWSLDLSLWRNMYVNEREASEEGVDYAMAKVLLMVTRLNWEKLWVSQSIGEPGTQLMSQIVNHPLWYVIEKIWWYCSSINQEFQFSIRVMNVILLKVIITRLDYKEYIMREYGNKKKHNIG